MEYSVAEIRALCERWLAGETTLAEESALGKFFASVHDGAQDGLPVDLRPYLPLFGQSAEAAGQRSNRELTLHTEPATPLKRPLLLRQVGSGRPGPAGWLTAAAGIAATVVVAVTFFVAPGRTNGGEVVCVVNGQRVTNPAMIAAYTREALELASDNLHLPGQTLSSKLSADPALTRVGEMLNQLTQNQ